jgi:hypothetical protein
MLPHAHVVSLDDGARREFFDQNLHQQRLEHVGPLGQRLQHQHVVLAIDN